MIKKNFVDNYSTFKKKLNESMQLGSNWVEEMGLKIESYNVRPNNLLLQNKSRDQNASYIEKLRALTELSDDYNLTIKNNDFRITHGLENLKLVHNGIAIYNNPNLQTFYGLRNLREVSSIEFYHPFNSTKLILLSMPINIEFKTCVVCWGGGESSWSNCKRYSKVWGFPGSGDKEFTNDDNTFNQFKALYDPRIYSEWDVNQIIRRVEKYGSDETRIEVLDHLIISDSGKIGDEKIWKKHYNETTKRYVKIILKDLYPNIEF